MNGPVKQEGDAHSAMTDNMSASSAAPQQGMMESMDSFIDLSDYDNVQYHSPSMSPANSKHSFVRTTAASTPASLLSTSQPMTGPSHQYDQYKQQTGFVPGAIATTFAVNQNSAQMNAGYNNFEMGYMPMAAAATATAATTSDDMFDFNSAPNNASVSPSDIGLDFDSPAPDAGFYFEANNSMNPPPPVIPGQAPRVMTLPSNNAAAAAAAAHASNVGRLWPGMHQQAALAKAQAQQRQQQQIIQQQQQQRQNQNPGKVPQQARHKSAQPSDPIVEQKITQLLNSMRQKTSSPTDANGAPLVNISRPKKDEEDMDEDERLLASEEGKKLSSKERRQLRNKVSARAFRSRRKEYISQLESEIANKVSENGDLRTQNRALIEENKRLSDLTRMLLGSPSFSDFLDRLSSNPSLVPQSQGPAQPQQQVQQPQQQQQPEQREAPKDVNPYAAQQQIGVAMIPEQHIDLSMLQIDSEPTFTFQPQVFAVRTPDMPMSIDTSILLGKSSNFVGSTFDEEEKVDMPIIEHPVTETETATASASVAVDAEFESDPLFALYHDAAASAAAPVSAPAPARSCKPVEVQEEIFGGISSEKALARFELVDAADEAVREVQEEMAIARITMLASSLAATSARLDMLLPSA